MGGTAPTATGSLQATPVSNLLVYLLDRRLDGTLVLEAPGGAKSAVWFEDGAPMKAKTAEPVIYLGRLLLEMGAIDDATESQTLAEVAKLRRLHGEILVARGAIDMDTLKDALREQLARQIEWMFTLPPQTIYGFYEGKNFLDQWGGRDMPRSKPLAMVWRGIHARCDEAFVQQQVSRLAGRELRLHVDSQVSRFYFGKKEQSVIDVLRAKPWRYEALCASGLLDEGTIQRLLYTLLITRHLDLGVPGAMPVGVDEPPSSSRVPVGDAGATARRRIRFGTGARQAPQADTPSSSPPAPRAEQRFSSPPASTMLGDPKVEAFKQEIRETDERVPKMNYYEIVGVERDAPGATIQAAFFKLAKRFHPDRLGPEYDDVREIVTRLFSRISEANQTLMDEERRAQYDQLLAEGGAGNPDEQEAVTRVLRAATAFQKAEVLLKKHNLVAAEEQAKAALEGDPEQAEYIALDAWIQSLKPDRANGPFDDLIARLEFAVAREPNNQRARWYRGQLFKRSGKANAAIKDFRWIAEHNPKHLDAIREVRLFEMRKNSTAPPEKKSIAPAKKDEGGGFLNKIFKR